mmetsp:Transcript_32066/g.63523  ORF Transcript_32066/g.63523 Transcript_32066/m.63523 type:complete len:80 (-) Transcript_32066:1157-1396(-)
MTSIYNPVDAKIERSVPVGMFRAGSLNIDARFDPIKIPDNAGNNMLSKEKNVGVMPVSGSGLKFGLKLSSYKFLLYFMS